MRLIDADPLIEDIADIYGFSISSVRCSLVGCVIANAPTIETKQIKYFDEDEKVWKIGEVIVADRKTENCSENPNNCEYAENPSGDVWECGCFLDTYCEHQIYDRNPDGTINIVECKDEPQTCETCKYGQDKHRYAHICNECGVGINNYTPQTERSE